VYGRIKIIITLVFFIVLSSCSSLRITDTRVKTGTFEVNSEKLLEGVKENNIIEEPLAINKISITYKEQGKRRRFRANLKFNGEETILVSIRTFAGIEAARILIDEDSVKIMDRLNKILYVGETDTMVKKYGLNKGFLKLFFGDIADLEAQTKRIKCKEGIAEINEYEKDKIVDYNIDCSLNKLVKVEGYWGEVQHKVRGTFKDFRSENGFLYPGKITWELEHQEIEMEIEMENIVRNKNNTMIFNTEPGYTIKRLR